MALGLSWNPSRVLFSDHTSPIKGELGKSSIEGMVSRKGALQKTPQTYRCLGAWHAPYCLRLRMPFIVLAHFMHSTETRNA